MTNIRSLLEDKGFFRIPLKKLNGGHYRFSAKINGRKGNFILDTGASTSCIGFDNISHFLMKNEKSDVKAAGAGATNMNTEIAYSNTFSIGNWNLKNMSFVIFDLSHVNEALLQVEDESVHGIIGADFLKQSRAVIDYGRNALYVK